MDERRKELIEIMKDIKEEILEFGKEIKADIKEMKEICKRWKRN